METEKLTMSIDTIQNPMWDNLRKLLKMSQEKDRRFPKCRITYHGDKIDVLIFHFIPRWFTVDNEGVYIKRVRLSLNDKLL